MPKKIHLFNPQHDLSLAAGEMEYHAPESAMQLASDLSLLPLWYADGGDTVISDTDAVLPPPVREVNVSAINDLTVGEDDRLVPWGWDRSVRMQFLRAGVPEDLLPSAGHIDRIRAMSHRRTAGRAMEYIKGRATDMRFPDTAVELASFREIEEFVAARGEAVLKAPWSGSGRGVFWCSGQMAQSLAGWCTRVIQRQGCVMGEPALDKVQDFAMEFHCGGGTAAFAGYSLFSTSGGVYRGNRMMSDAMIEAALAEYVPVSALHTVRGLLTEFLSAEIAPHYSGYVGVDMMVYRDGGELLVNPAVEINLRMTMGMVARTVYDRHVAAGKKGWFHIGHQPPGLLAAQDREMRTHMPLKTDGNRIASGYCPLVPVTESSVYTAFIIIDE